MQRTQKENKIKISVAKELAKKHGFDKVIIFGINELESTVEGTSYGVNKTECVWAKKIMQHAWQAIYNFYKRMK